MREDLSEHARIGCVVIGRNEGSRLRACLTSLPSNEIPIVYVDSGSTDASIAVAEAYQAIIVELDLDRPFTAGRARNTGYSELVSRFPKIEYVQFIDGDCTTASGWLRAARDWLDSHSNTAIVCGHRREIHPETSLFNRLCDIEWATPIGESDSCGGDFMVRKTVFSAANGFHETLIAGEEPELCYRIRKTGMVIRKLDNDMTFHDANILEFRQWARRATRAGYAYAARAYLHIGDRQGYCFRENIRIMFWALGLPIAISIGLFWNVYVAFGALAVYPIQLVRITLSTRQNIQPASLRIAHSLFQIMGKFFELVGVLQFARRRLSRLPETLIEYK